jgi:hypothetical protein
VYISIYAEEFNISPAVASGLISYPNLAFGFGKWFQGWGAITLQNADK